MQLVKKLLVMPKRAMHWFWHLSFIKKVFIGLLIGGLLWFGYTHSNQANEKKPQYQTEKVGKETILETVSVSGNVTSSSQMSITSTTTGVIEEVYVKNGDRVTTGQNLFKVKSTSTPKEQATAYANYQTAVNTLKVAEQAKQTMQATLEKSRQSILDAQQAVDDKNANLADYSQTEKDSVDSALTSARHTFAADEKKYREQDTAIAAAQANLSATAIAYQETQNAIITAPIDGTVANLSSKVGTHIRASSNADTTNAGSTVLVLGDFSQLAVTTTVNEVDITKIKAGQKATITIDAFPDKTFVGTIESVDSIGTSSSGVVTYTALIAFESAPNTILAGMTASATIQTQRHDAVLVVPNSAIITSNGQTLARIIRNGEMTMTPVEIGIASDTSTEIISGLSEGDTIVTSVGSVTNAGMPQTSSPFSTFGGRGGPGGGGPMPVLIHK